MKNMNLVLCISLVCTTASFYMHSDYKSQLGQDKYFNENFFKNKRDGVFVDIGAYDGITNSNSWFFEKELGWKGICIEPLPHAYKKLREMRNCICVNAAISDKEGVANFRQIKGTDNQADRAKVDQLSGLESKYEDKHKELIDRALRELGGTYETIEVNCVVLNDLLSKHGIYDIDLLSIDTEGGELEILKTFDFEKFHVYALTVENNYKSPLMGEFLKSKGFRLVKTLHVDELYINTRPSRS